jgi:hypothetical protein
MSGSGGTKAMDGECIAWLESQLPGRIPPGSWWKRKTGVVDIQ